MPNDLPPIFFYIPQKEMPEGNIPQSPEDYWHWITTRRGIPRFWGMYNWTLQTYLYLKDRGFPCEFTCQMPDEGIVLSHRDSLSDDLRPNSRRLLVCVLGDKEQPRDKGLHPFAQLHVVQNPRDPRLVTNEFAYVPFWPQPGLIPRSPSRGDRFENIAFYGYEVNLAPELRSPTWASLVQSLGLNWFVVPSDRFHDYEQTDAMVAVRSFGATTSYLYKPATKLHNAWRANVPAVLGVESAYRSERQNELDFIEVASLDDLVAALVRLRDDVPFRQRIVANGATRAIGVQSDRVVGAWIDFLTDVATPAYERWLSGGPGRRIFFVLEGAVQRRALILKATVRRIFKAILRVQFYQRLLRSLGRHFLR
ncbi:MAG: hypothetical protein AB1898_19545 [Acidobacteriota bacterium]